MKRDRGAHRRAHRREPGALEKSAAVPVRLPVEHNPVGALRILGVKLKEVDALFVLAT